MKTSIGLGDAQYEASPRPRTRAPLNVEEFQLRPPRPKSDHAADAARAWEVVTEERAARVAAERDAHRYKTLAVVGIVSTILTSAGAILGWSRALPPRAPKPPLVPTPPPRKRP